MNKVKNLISTERLIFSISAIIVALLFFSIITKADSETMTDVTATSTNIGKALVKNTVPAEETIINDSINAEESIEENKYISSRGYEYYKALYGPAPEPQMVEVNGQKFEYIPGAPYSVYEDMAKANETVEVISYEEPTNYSAGPSVEIETIYAETAEETEETITEAEETPEETPEVTYSGDYSPSDFKWMGVISWGGSKWTYYSQRVLPGEGLNIPGRHVDSDGFVCDENGYIVLAADLSYISRGTVIDTPFGRPGKIYDTGCAYGVVDCYCDW